MNGSKRFFGYKAAVWADELQRAIELIHQEFQHSLCVRLNLHRVSAPAEIGPPVCD